MVTNALQKMQKNAQQQAKKFYDSHVTRHLAFEVNYADEIDQHRYLIVMMAHPIGEDGIFGSEVARMPINEFSYDDFVAVLQTLFNKWHFPIYVTPSEPQYVSERLLKRLKETFHDAVKLGDVYDF